MTEPEDAWRSGLEDLGRFIHAQRKLAKLSLRELGALTDVSNAYLSQLERGLHEPSMRVIRSIARALDMSAETLLRQAGIFEGGAGRPDEPVAPTERSILADASLTAEQKAALIAVYRGFARPDAEPGDEPAPEPGGGAST